MAAISPWSDHRSPAQRMLSPPDELSSTDALSRPPCAKVMGGGRIRGVIRLESHGSGATRSKMCNQFFVGGTTLQQAEDVRSVVVVLVRRQRIGYEVIDDSDRVPRTENALNLTRAVVAFCAGCRPRRSCLSAQPMAGKDAARASAAMQSMLKRLAACEGIGFVKRSLPHRRRPFGLAVSSAALIGLLRS
jgi:hypothetical protein